MSLIGKYEEKMVVFWVVAPCSLLVVYQRRIILPSSSGLKQEVFGSGYIHIGLGGVSGNGD
jgi:hypothetical protein